MKAYYQLSGEEVLREVNGSEEPLTKEQISENQRKYGPNELTEGKKKTTFQIFWSNIRIFGDHPYYSSDRIRIYGRY